MDQIRLKISGTSENEKKCTILLDEVAIMKTLEYNKGLDEIEGYEDLGTYFGENKYNRFSSISCYGSRSLFKLEVSFMLLLHWEWCKRR